MQVSSYPLEELLPHRPPMVLIDDVLSFDEHDKKVVAAVTIRPSWSESWVAIELMAQTAAALAGCMDRAKGYTGEPKPGFLLGARRFDLSLPHFEVGARYLISATCVFGDGEAASFECEISDGSRVLATATLNAYRPENIDDFREEQK